MSDTPQGDGWWQTSDGKWHPPDYDPTGGATAAPPETSGGGPPWARNAGTDAPGSAPLFGDAPQPPPWTPPPVPQGPGVAGTGETDAGDEVTGEPPAPDASGGGVVADPSATPTLRPGEFGLPSETPRTPPEPTVVRSAHDADGGSRRLSPVLLWGGLAALVVLAAALAYVFFFSGSDEEPEVASDDATREATVPSTTVPSTTAAPTTSVTTAVEGATETAPPSIRPGERLPVLTFSGTDNTVVALDPPGPRVARITYSGTGTFRVKGLDQNDEEVAVYVDEEGPYSGDVAVDFRDEQDSRSLSITAGGPWQIEMVPVESLLATERPFRGTGDAVVLYSGDVGNVGIRHNGSGTFSVNTFEIKTRDIQTLVEKTGSFVGNVELRGPAFVWINADGEWSITPS